MNCKTIPQFRKYGAEPFRVAVVHGGPGAQGEMAPVARELAPYCGILEPLQNADSVQGQLLELKTLLEKEGTPPMVLLGFSWGAWLSFLVAAEYPQLVKKLILVGCPPFEEKYVARIKETRQRRLTESERRELNDFVNLSPERFEELFLKSDAYKPIEKRSEVIQFQEEVYKKVWDQAKTLRTSEKLLEMGEKILCPVLAIHGDYDPHPSEGVQESLGTVLKEFHFVLLEKCGHAPWNEQEAKDPFFSLLKKEIGP